MSGADTKAIARRDPEPSGLTPRTFEQIDSIAQKIAKTGFAGVKSADEAFVRVLAGASLGLAPIQALMAIHVVKGRPSLSAQAMLALVRASPLCERFEIVESTRERCVVETKRRRATRPQRVEWTIERAKAAGLIKRAQGEKGEPTPWENYPEVMLRWRAISELARLEYSEITLGLYTPEEAAAIPGPGDGDGTVIDVIAREVQAEASIVPASPAAAEPTKTASRGEERYAALLRRIGDATRVIGKDVAARIAGGPIKGKKPSELEAIAERLEIEAKERRRIEAEEAAMGEPERPLPPDLDRAAKAVIAEARANEELLERERGALQGREPGSEG